MCICIASIFVKQQIEIHVERGRSIDLAILYAKRRKSIFDWISSQAK